MVEAAPLGEQYRQSKNHWAKIKNVTRLAASTSAAFLLSACWADEAKGLMDERSSSPNPPDAEYVLDCQNNEQLTIEVPPRGANDTAYYTVVVDVITGQQTSQSIKFNLPTIDRSTSITVRDGEGLPDYHNSENGASYQLLDGELQFTMLTDENQVLQSIILSCN